MNVGWKLVPVEPTYQMCEAINVGWETGSGFPTRYKAMLAAAPTPEVDPVAYMRHRITSGSGGFGGGVVVEFSEHPFGGFDDPAAQDRNATIEALYAHPAPSDKLVKAASEFCKAFDRQDKEVLRYLNELRAAHDKVKS